MTASRPAPARLFSRVRVCGPSVWLLTLHAIRSTWIGGSILGTLGTFTDMSISV